MRNQTLGIFEMRRSSQKTYNLPDTLELSGRALVQISVQRYEFPVLARLGPAGHVPDRFGIPPASDSAAPLSGFDPIRSDEHQGPDVPGAPGEGRMQISGNVGATSRKFALSAS